MHLRRTFSTTMIAVPGVCYSVVLDRLLASLWPVRKGYWTLKGLVSGSTCVPGEG